MPATAKRATQPIVRAQCTIQRDDCYGDGLPHLEPLFETVTRIGRTRLKAELSLRMYVKGGAPLMCISACDRNGEWTGDGGLCLEEIPADVGSLDALITVISAMREAVVRETPAILRKMQEFDAYVERFKEPPYVPAKKAKRKA